MKENLKRLKKIYPTPKVRDMEEYTHNIKLNTDIISRTYALNQINLAMEECTSEEEYDQFKRQ